MSFHNTVRAERVHIGFFGCRNAGKSSLVNAVTGQSLSVVSDTAGTTTDPVKKSMELLPIGPVVIVDTPGIDDIGALGEQRVARTKEVLQTIDLAVLVLDAQTGMRAADEKLRELILARHIPYVLVWNKADLVDEKERALLVKKQSSVHTLFVSAKHGTGIEQLKAALGALRKPQAAAQPLIADRLQAGDLVILVVPIDEAAPKGRLILPQQQTLRELLDAHVRALVVRESELSQTLAELAAPPALVITDSQVFGMVQKIVPPDVLLTSFSILMARHKGFLELAASGAVKLDALRDGDRVLICEGCTHHRQCGDIGTQKLPDWLRAYTKKELELTFSSGKDFAEALADYALIIHCGGCMLTEREVQARMEQAAAHGIPVTNYGTAIAKMNGILERSLEVFPELLQADGSV